MLIPYNYNLRAREFHHTASTAARTTTTAKPASIWTPLTKHSLSSELISRTQPSASQVREWEMLIFWCKRARASDDKFIIYSIFSPAWRKFPYSIWSARCISMVSLELGEIRFHAYACMCASPFCQWKNRCARLEFFSLSLFLKSLPIRCVKIEKDWFHSFCAFARHEIFLTQPLQLYSSDLENCHSYVLAFCWFLYSKDSELN